MQAFRGLGENGRRTGGAGGGGFARGSSTLQKTIFHPPSRIRFGGRNGRAVQLQVMEGQCGEGIVCPTPLLCYLCVGCLILCIMNSTLS